MIHRLFECFGRDVPRDYLCVGLVTTGLTFGFSSGDLSGYEPPGLDVILQLGHCDVRDGQADKSKSLTLNWSLLPELIEPLWLENTIGALTERMAQDGKTYPLTYDMVRQSKCHPITGLQHYVDVLEDAIDADKMIVGHNLIGFGAPALADATGEWLGERFEIPPECTIDVGLLRKAAQIGEFPAPGEALPDFLERVYDMWVSGVRWGLDHCCRAYGVCDKCDVKPTPGAGHTAQLCHLLLEAVREAVAV